MKSIATHLSSIILQGSMKKVSGSKIIILITLLLFGFSTLYSQNPRLEHRIMNLRYESTYAFPGNTGLVPPVGPFNSPALVFDLEVRAGENYKSTGWAMGTADIELRYIIEPGVTIREMALWRTTLPVPNPHTIANAFVTWYPFGFLYPNVARIHIGRYYSAGNPYANDFTEAWAKICTIAIPVLSGTPTSATCFELMVSNGLPTHSSWCSAMAPNPDDYQFFNAACPARSCLGMPDHVTFNYDYTLNLCYGDPAITLPNTSNEGVTGVWEPSNIITTDAVGSTEYKFVPDDPLWCEAIILANVLPPTEIEVEPAIWACPGIVDLTPAIIPNPDLKGTYKFYTLEGTNYIETGSLVTLAGMTAVTFYVHYTETDSCPSRYVPFQVEFITPPNIPDIYFECDNGLITDIVINVHQDDCVYSIDGITYQTGLVFGPFIPGTDPSYTVYVMDTITGCITTKFIECQTCDDIPEITVTDPGSGAICYAAGVTYAVDVEFMYADSVVVSHNGYGNLDYEVFYAPTMSFTSIYTPVAADAGNTVTLTFKIPAANTCPEVVETVDIVVNPMPSVVVNVAGKDTSVCYSANYTFNLEHLVTLGAGDELQHSFTKSFTSGTYSITPTVVIPYNTSQYVYLRAVNNTTGCPASAIDSIRLTVNPSPTVSVTVTGKDTVVCSDGPVIFDLTTMVSFTDCDSLVFSESKDFIPPVANITAFTVTPEVYDLKLYVKGVNKSTECETDEADIDSVTISVLLIAYSTDTYDICGASFTWTNGDGNVYTSSNNTATHTITGGAANGCDSIVTLNLTLRPIAYGVDTYDECGASFTWTNGDGNVYTSSNNTATHTITGGAANGCDSIVTLNLTLRPIAYGTDVHNICGATSFDWIDGNTYTSDNNTATWKIDNGAANGCDSIVTLNLTFTPYATGTDVIVLPCGQTSFDWIDGNTYTSDNNTATHTITGGSVNGCDSIVTLNLTFRHIAHSTDTYDVCGASFTWTNGNGNVYTSSNNTATHTVTGGAANGCDSIVTLNLTLRPIAYSTDTYNVCGASFTWTNGDGNVYTSSNNTATHTITGGAANGCDSIVTLNLTLRPIAYGTDVINICGTSYQWINGVTYTSSNNTATHTITGGAANGCDSIVTLNLTIRPIAYGTDVIVLQCGQTSFQWIDGVTYTSNNNTATWTISGGAANGCDSIVTLNLTFRPFALATNINASDVTICYGQTATLTATSNLMNPVFRWYTSQTATTPIHVGATLVTGILTANTTYYVSVMGTNVCENEPGARKPVTVIVDLCKLMNCDLLTDKVVKEDGPYACKYTHSGTGWDAKTAALIPNPFDNVKYYLNGVLTNPENTLNGVEFPLGLSQVMVEAFFDILIDTCYFNVYVERVCPTVSDPDGDGNTYPVTSVGGLCWTSNLKTTTYTNGNEIAFAKPYYSSIYNDVEANTNNFGLLYTWYSALGIPEGDNTQVPANYQGICPDGWHIPTQAELDQLNVWTARDLKSTSYWIQPGTNLSGFDSRGAGKFLVAVGKCVDLYGYTGYWASDADPGLFAPYISLLYYLDNCDILMGEIDKNDGISVRCVWDGEGCE